MSRVERRGARFCRVDSLPGSPQGRYLLPSLAASAAFASVSPLRQLQRGLVPAAILVALATLAPIALAFR